MSGSLETGDGKKDFLFVNSVAKAVQVLEAFRGAGESASLTELTHKTGLSLSAVQRFTHTWEALGYLQKDPQSRRYRLTVAALELGYLFLCSSPLVARAMPHMVMAHEKHGLPMNLSLLSGSDVIYIVRLPHRSLKFVETLPGRRVPAFCNSAGRAFLSHLPDDRIGEILAEPKIAFTAHTLTGPAELRAEIEKARAQGYAFTRDQVLPGQLGIGKVVYDSRRQPIAAINLVMSSDEWTEERVVEELVPQLFQVAAAISGL
ncbi:IclR family transcriptional regulator [Oleispirillum naphthae]|uniref:IclR family transcriptional regulator n=1 Tax=Oleispirillum naphthae TaxID=2838853 RepID=UPI00308252B0